MKTFLLGLLALLLTVLKIVLMGLAYVVISAGEGLEHLREAVDRKRGALIIERDDE